jgi:hypothetical protein
LLSFVSLPRYRNAVSADSLAAIARKYAMSALSAKADVQRICCHVSFVPPSAFAISSGQCGYNPYPQQPRIGAGR